MLGCDDSWSVETPKMKNHSFTVPSVHILLSDKAEQLFETPKNHSVTAPSRQCTSVYFAVGLVRSTSRFFQAYTIALAIAYSVVITVEVDIVPRGKH